MRGPGGSNERVGSCGANRSGGLQPAGWSFAKVQKQNFWVPDWLKPSLCELGDAGKEDKCFLMVFGVLGEYEP